MTATAQRVFTPNAVLIPASAVWRDSRGEHPDPEQCPLLYIDGDRSYAEVYTREAWEQGGKPSYVLRDDTYFITDDNGEETDTPLASARLSITTAARQRADAEGDQPIDRIQLLPEMFCVKEDETAYWDTQFRREHKIKRIFGLYVFNRRKAVHVCEIVLPQSNLENRSVRVSLT